MQVDEKMLRNRLSELAERAYESGRCTFTSFLGLAELDVFYRMRREIEYAGISTFGGAEGCERQVVRFGGAGGGYVMPFPISLIKAEPVERRFADRLTHRDILGALLGTGIERDMTGDIYIYDNTAYIFCLDKVKDHVLRELKSAKRTVLRLSLIDSLPDVVGENTVEDQVLISSERADVLVAAVFRLSRSEAAELFGEKRVYLDGRLCEEGSYIVKEGSIVSVRSLGRFRYLGYESLSRKGRLYARIKRWN